MELSATARPDIYGGVRDFDVRYTGIDSVSLPSSRESVVPSFPRGTQGMLRNNIVAKLPKALIYMPLPEAYVRRTTPGSRYSFSIYTVDDTPHALGTGAH